MYRLPAIEVIFYQEEDGTVPLLAWLDNLTARAQDKCLARLKRLKDLGHELRRPEADYDGHALAMLRRIAESLGKRVEIRLVSTKHQCHTA